MLDGLALFAEGLFDQAIKRAKEDNLDLAGSFKQEISEMDIFREIARTKGDKALVLLGITLAAQGLYKGGVDAQSAKEIEHVFFENVRNQVDFCIALDAEYYENLRPKHGPVQALYELGDWIDTYKIGSVESSK